MMGTFIKLTKMLMSVLGICLSIKNNKFLYLFTGKGSSFLVAKKRYTLIELKVIHKQVIVKKKFTNKLKNTSNRGIKKSHVLSKKGRKNKSKSKFTLNQMTRVFLLTIM